VQTLHRFGNDGGDLGHVGLEPALLPRIAGLLEAGETEALDLLEWRKEPAHLLLQSDSGRYLMQTTDLSSSTTVRPYFALK
jgi:hypothetical protein